MERLTIKYEGLFVPKKTCTIDRFGEADDCDSCDSVCESDCENCAVQECFTRLGEYEDTGLTPEQIQEIDRLYAEKCQEVAKLRQRDMPERPKILEEIQKSEDEYINEDHHPMFKLGAASIAAEIKDIIKKHLCCKSDADVSSGAAQSKIEGEKEDVKEVE